MRLQLKWWWYLLPGYLTLWTVFFSIWSLLDGYGMMEAFQVDTGGASEFVMLNSAARYFAIAVAMILGIWVFGTYQSILTALLTRFTMDMLDLYAGWQTGLVQDPVGVAQSLLMFLLPNLIAMVWLIKAGESQ